MKRLLSCLLLCLVASVASAADAHWLTSLPDAEAQAQRQHKLVLMNFTGSDWCPGCIELEKRVLATSEFSNYASKHLVLVLVDFPAAKPQTQAVKVANEALQEKYKIDGYPSLVLVKPDGNKIWEKDGYDGESASALVSKIVAAGQKS